ncbi:hypothetical protein BV898_09920 [Hypsibius exemplaris]|uniref:Uncharacterized protein n=1 Tax=Hypsibius exemplaris TaxID=2072580 RepID=A0A1W0WLA7_HYPEX|nr:hypothetical protein BV898_09920 [Hypsibius exemplaris]
MEESEISISLRHFPRGDIVRAVVRSSKPEQIWDHGAHEVFRLLGMTSVRTLSCSEAPDVCAQFRKMRRVVYEYGSSREQTMRRLFVQDISTTASRLQKAWRISVQVARV